MIRKMLTLLTTSLFPTLAYADYSLNSIWKPEYSIDTNAIFSAEVSPDGKKTLIGIFESSLNLTNGASRFIILSNVTGKTLWQTPKKTEYIEGRWSPDGNWISLIKEDKSNERTLEITASNHFNPIKVCSFPTMRNHSWAPNGQKISFLSGNDEDSEFLKLQDQLQPSYKVLGITIARESGAVLIPTRLHVVNTNIQEKKFSEPYLLTPITMSIDSYNARIHYSWSPDSQQIIVTFIPIDSQQRDEDRRLAIIHVNTKEIQYLEKIGVAGDPVFSPNGKTIAFIAPVHSSRQEYLENNDLLITDSTIHLLDIATQKVSQLPQTPNARPSILGWTSDSLGILVQDLFRTTQSLYLIPIDGPSESLPLNSIKYFEDARLNMSHTHISLIGQSFDKAPEVYVASLKDFMPKQLTNFHKNLPNLSEIKTEVVTWTSYDGKKIEGILVYPKGYQKGQKIPLLVDIHGGPAGVWAQSYVGFRSEGTSSFASLSSYGFGVFAPNIRGSNGYGAPFRKSIYKDWGHGPFKDIMTGIDSLIEKGIVDPEKLAITGVSYGGYMAAWATTQTDRFKAAIVNAGPVDLIPYICTGETASLVESYFGGYFWQDYDAWLENSPIMHVENIKTPTLIQHGDEDSVVVSDQGTELFYALKTRNIPVHMSVYFNQWHGLHGKSAILGSEEALAWLTYYVNPSQKTIEKEPIEKISYGSL